MTIYTITTTIYYIVIALLLLTVPAILLRNHIVYELDVDDEWEEEAEAVGNLEEIVGVTA